MKKLSGTAWSPRAAQLVLPMDQQAILTGEIK
jgi:hypothetical protein